MSFYPLLLVVLVERLTVLLMIFIAIRSRTTYSAMVQQRQLFCSLSSWSLPLFSLHCSNAGRLKHNEKPENDWQNHTRNRYVSCITAVSIPIILGNQQLFQIIR